MNNTFFKKTLSVTLLSILIGSPFITFAQNTNTTNAPRAIVVEGNNTYQPISLQNSQGNAALYGANSTGGSASISGAAGSFASCSGAGALGNFVKNKISSLLGSVVSGDVLVNDTVQRGKDTGILGLVSWDQMGWCLVNSIIESVGAATVNWINSGFQGNPVFIENPEQFFADVADIQAGAFLNELTGGFMCEPIQNLVRVNLATNYNSSISPYGDRAQCTFSGSVENLESFMSGENFSWDDWMSYTQNPNNNPFGATINGQIELNNRIASSLGVQSTLLDWGGGFFSSKDPKTGEIKTPGSVIEKQLNDRLGSGQRRLEIADEFDEIVNALVNQLIKVAISEVTQSTR